MGASAETGQAAACAASEQAAARPASGRSIAQPILEVRDLRCGYGKKGKRTEIVHGVDFDLHEAEFMCIIGANGCGKTTTLKTVMGLLPALGGSASVRGADVFAMPERELARHFAYIPQAHTPPFPFSVGDVVLMGRTAHMNRLARTSHEDRLAAYRAMRMLGIHELADTPYTQLSGGQQQMALIARALAQEADILVMDEPTASLDFGNQQLVLSRMRVLSQMGKAVIMVTHDPDHALFCADTVVVMERGSVLKIGPTRDCITSDVLQRIYATSARVLDVEVSPGCTKRVCIPLENGTSARG